MGTQLNLLLEELKQKNEDFELYPSSEEMIRVVWESCKNKYDVSSFLDIGCGTCNFWKYWNKFGEKSIRYYVMEKSSVLLQQIPKEAIVLGTDFEKNSLIDKPVDAIFCNPPYSKYAEWTTRIILESLAKYCYLIIPQRWKENADINAALKSAKATAITLGSFDFLDAERKARAKVDIVCVSKEKYRNNAFDLWFDKTFPMPETEEKTDYKKESEKAQILKDKIVSAENKVDMFLSLYEEELGCLQKHFKAISELDIDVLESINVHKTAVKEALQNKIRGLKTRYWWEVFNNLGELTSRLTSDTREKMLSRYSDIYTVDFNFENIYAMLIWVCKNASAYYDEQLIDWFKTFTAPDNIIKYKSNQRVFKRNEWYNKRFDEPNSVSHYCLSYRIICDRHLFSSGNSWEGLEGRQSQTVVNDLSVLANNLGFIVGKKEFPSMYGEKYYIYDTDGKPLIEYKVYQNGNTHLKLDKEFCKAMNVEVSRLLGWIQKKEDIKNEFPDELSNGAEKYFGRNLSITGTSLKLLK